MSDAPKRQYLDDVPRDIQDLIYEGRGTEVPELLMAQRSMGKMPAAMEAARIWSRMQAEFPGAAPELSPESGEPTSSKKAILGWIFVIVLTLVGATMTILGVRGLILAHASKSWPTVQGKITESFVERSRGRSNSGKSTSSYHLRIRYAFTVDGTPHTGDRAGYGDHIGRENASHANRIVRRFPKGKEVTVYYQAGNPRECLLEPGVKGRTFILPSIGLFILAIGGVLLWAAVSVAKDEPEAARKSAATHPGN